MDKQTGFRAAVVYLPAVLFLVVLTLFSRAVNIPVEVLTRDMATIGEIHPLFGLLSNLGILLWCAAATVCVLGAAVLSRAGGGERVAFLVSSALLTMVLMLDDFFLIHDALIEEYVGLPQRVMVALYGLATLAYLFRFRRLILSTNFTFLGAALVFFAISVVVDDLLDAGNLAQAGWIDFAEDSAKFLGLVGWCAYFAQVCREWLVAALQADSRQGLSSAASASAGAGR